MKDYFERPAVFYGAQTKQGLNWFLEILSFLGVMIVASMAEAFIILPGTIILLCTNKEVMDVAIAGDIEKVQEMAQSLMNSDFYAITALFATIMMTIVAILFCKLIQKRKITSLGFRKPGLVKEYLFGMLFGFLLFSFAVGICVMTGSLKITGLSAQIPVGILILYFIGYMFQGMSEETLCRGYFMGSVARRYALPVAIIMNAVVFAALHLANQGISVLAFINLILFGIFASIYFIKRGNIWGIAAMHFMWNFVQGNLYGIRVSGLNFSSSIFNSEMIPGADLMNGGRFGLEGGLGVTIALTVGIVILFFMKGKINIEEIEMEKQNASAVCNRYQPEQDYAQINER